MRAITLTNEIESPMADSSLTNKNPDALVLKDSDLLLKAKQWRDDTYKKQVQNKAMQNKVLQNIEHITSIITESEALNNETSHKIHRMNWAQFYELPVAIMDEYSSNVESILQKMDQLCRKQYLWQEAAFVIDSNRGASYIGRAEEWIKLKENYLSHMRDDLKRSATEINATIERINPQQ